MARKAVGSVEHRQLTVLFCDLVGSTTLASELGTEPNHEFIMTFLQFCARTCEEASGHVARFEGDGVLSYFGFPEPLEDATQRAVHAGLRLREAGRNLPSPSDRPLSVRVGIATGFAIVGEVIGSDGASEYVVSGRTPNLAKRLQSIAEPNSVAVSETTMQLAAGIFEFRPLGSLDLKGLSAPVPAWAPIKQRPIVSRFAGLRGADVSPLIGRARELDDIVKAWDGTRGGTGRVVGIVGEAGVGKSRLLKEAHRLICRNEQVTWLEGGGAEMLDQTPFHVVAQFAPKLAALDRSGDAELDRAMGILSGKSGVTDGDDALAERQTLLQVLKQRIDEAARRGPTVLAVEDLHWADPSTLELFDRLATDLKSPLFFLYTARKDLTGRWPASAQHRVLTLDPLDDAASAALARAATDDRIDLSQVGSIVAQAGGIPLFIEELARLIATRAGAAIGSEIPSSLADLLAARLEQLGFAKWPAQIASVLGQEFSDDLFAAMVELDRLDPQSALAELETQAIVVRAASNAPGHHVFRHAVFADAAYNTLLTPRKHELHRRAALLIARRFPDLAEAQPQLLVRHWKGTGDVGKTVEAWERVGSTAGARHAFQEAEHAFREALAALDGGTDIPYHDRIALGLNARLNGVLQITRGYTSGEVSSVSQRVQDLAVKMGDARSLWRQKSVKWREVFTAGDYAQAARLVEEVMALSKAQGDVLWRRTFHLRAGIQHGFYTGHLARGERAFLDWRAADDGSHRGIGDDVLSMGIAALIAHMTGRQKVAEQRSALAFEIAERRGDPYDRAMALHTQSCLHHFAREPERLARSAAQLTEVAAQCGFEYAGWLAQGWVGVANVHAGRPAPALEQIGAAVAAFERLGARVSLVFWLHVLGWAHRHGGAHETAHETYRGAMTVNRQERAFRLEAHLGRADLLSAMGRPDEAARELRHGANLAAAMGATSYRLRALVAAARLHLARGDDAGLARVLPAIDALLQPGYCAAERDDVAALARQAGYAFDLGRMADAAEPVTA